MADVTCIQLDSDVALSTEKGNKLAFKKGEILMIMFTSEDTNSDYNVCSGGGGLPFVWVDKKSSHKIITMELSAWQKSRQSKQWHRFALPMTVSQ